MMGKSYLHRADIDLITVWDLARFIKKISRIHIDIVTEPGNNLELLGDWADGFN